jgi:hypothetical protein
MHLGRALRSLFHFFERGSGRRSRALQGAWVAIAVLASGCGSDDDYYFVNELRGEGDTVRLEFLYTCGKLELSWNGTFSGHSPVQADLSVKHDAPGDCPESQREISFDVGPMKLAFRAEHPDPAPLGLRVPPYRDDQGAICIANLFQTEPFKGHRCK